MSNAMSRSKSRWKGALLAAAATAVVTPLAAKAQTASLQVGLSLSGTSPTSTSYEYIAPDATVPVYVWATVAEQTALSSSNIAGLQYLYYNVNANVGSGSPLGILQSATLSPLFSGGAFNLSGGSEGAQIGNVSTGAYTATTSIALGDSTNMTNMAKPRAVSAVYSTNTSAGVVVSGNKVSFLVETLNYKPSFTPVVTAPGGAGDELNLGVVVPTLGVNYAGANYFSNLSSTPSGSGVGATNTSTGYTASATGITLIDAQAGDANLDGIINSADYSAINHNYGLNVTPGSTDAGWTNGDLNTDGIVNSADYGAINHNYGVKYGPSGGFGPLAEIGSPTAEIGLSAGAASAVPEPGSLSLLALGSLAVLKRRRLKK